MPTSMRRSSASPTRAAPTRPRARAPRPRTATASPSTSRAPSTAWPFDGGTGEGIQVVIGAGQFIPGFEEQLIGIGVGETRTLKVSFPKNYASEKLAGQPAEFETTATAIEAPGETTIDDEFAKTLGLESLDKLKEAARGAARRPNSPARRASASSARCSTGSTRATNSRRRRRWSPKSSI